MHRLTRKARRKQNGAPRQGRHDKTITMTPTGTPGQDAASIAVLQTQQTNIERQLTELQRSTGDALSKISGQLDKLSDMSLEMGRIGQTIHHQSETMTRAHARLDTLERDLSEHTADSAHWREGAVVKLEAKVAPLAAKVDAVATTQTRWSGIYIGVQTVLALLLGVLLWVANGYMAKVDVMSTQLNRAERIIDTMTTKEEKP